jgi:hypothetical protein
MVFHMRFESVQGRNYAQVARKSIPTVWSRVRESFFANGRNGVEL